MKIHYYLDALSNPFIDKVQNSMIAYLKNSEHELKVIPYKDYREDGELDCDLAIFFGIYTNLNPVRTAFKKNLYIRLKKENKGLLILEKGFIDRDRYYSVGWNSNVGYGYYHNQNSPDDRLKQLNIKIHPHRHAKNGYILLCGQIPHDTQLQHLGSKKYLIKLQEAVNEIRSVTKRKIVFRNHPKLVKKGREIKLNGAENSKNKKIEQDLAQAWAVVGFNSNSLLESMILGYPVFVLDPGSLIYSIANHDLKQIEDPKFSDPVARYQVLCDIAYTQWNADEVKKGLAFEHVIKGYDEARKRHGSEPNFNLNFLD